jgi:F0F1-type ATP synthase assembly protein I
MEKDKGLGDRLGEANEDLQNNLDRNEHQIFASYGLVGAILVFAALGYFADRLSGTAPRYLMIGLAVGIAIGFYSLVKIVRR